MSGRPCAPHNRRYYAIGKGPGVYVAEGGGLVKVGMSSQLPYRLVLLSHQYKRFGLELQRFAIFRVGNIFKNEVACIKALQSVATTVPGRLEFFTGIDFDAAVRVCSTTLSGEPEHVEPA
jgi:hypothetical protein